MLVHKWNFLLQLLLKIDANFHDFIATKTCPGYHTKVLNYSSDNIF